LYRLSSRAGAVVGGRRHPKTGTADVGPRRRRDNQDEDHRENRGRKGDPRRFDHRAATQDRLPASRGTLTTAQQPSKPMTHRKPLSEPRGEKRRERPSHQRSAGLSNTPGSSNRCAGCLRTSVPPGGRRRRSSSASSSSWRSARRGECCNRGRHGERRWKACLATSDRDVSYSSALSTLPIHRLSSGCSRCFGSGSPRSTPTLGRRSVSSG
jgi:hypothetical protein